MLSQSFAYLLKENDQCSKDECCWVAATVFDHWLYESDSYHLIDEASPEQKEKWDAVISQFLSELSKLESPLKYKYLGRYPKKRLQFSTYIGSEPYGQYIASLFKATYEPNLVFPEHGIHIWFEDGWVIYIVYQNIEKFASVCQLASECGLYLLPVYSAGQLNQYEALSQSVPSVSLNKSSKRDAVTGAPS